MIKANSQTIIDQAVIEYEVKTNIKKTLGNSSWAEMLKDNLGQFKTAFYTLSIANNKSIYKFDHWDPKGKVPEFLRRGDEESSWFVDQNTGKYIVQKELFGTKFNIEDSLRDIQWKLSSERRIIAGYNCRKAEAVIMDSVYIFAFYTDEIAYSGGPCTITGLPGTILGLTIPRLYSSYIATKITLNNVNVSSIKPVTAKKYLTQKALYKTLSERIKDWISEDSEDDKMWASQLFWNTQL